MTINKNTDLEFSLQKETEKGGVYTNFYTEDKGSASIRIRLSSNGYYLDLTKIDLKPVLFLFHEDGSIFEIKDFINVMPDKGLIQYNLSDNVIAHAGKVKAKLFLKNTKQSVHVANFTFDIKDSGIEGAVAKEINVNLVEDTLRKIIQDEAIVLLDDDFKSEVFEGFQNYVTENVEEFKGPKGDVDYDVVSNIVRDETAEVKNNMDKVYKTQTKSVNIYVRPNGNDDTGNGSTKKPFKTIQRAVDTIPKLIEKDHFIKVAEGEYNEEVTIKGISGSAVWISRENGIVNPTTTRPNVKVKSITYYDCNAYCKVESVEQLKAGEIQGQGFIRFSRCSYGTVHACLMDDGSITKPTLIWDRSGGGFNSCLFNNQRRCANSMNGSAIRCDATNTHGSIKSDIGVVVQAAEIFYNGTVTWIEGATRPESYTQGGIINKYAVEIDLTTKNGWNSYSTDYRPRALKMPDGTVHLYGLVKDGTPGSGSVAFTLPKGYAPKVKGIYGGFVSNGTIGKILIDTSGNFSVESMTGQYISLSGISFYAGF